MYVISEVDGSALFLRRMMLLGPDALYWSLRATGGKDCTPLPHHELDKYAHQGCLIVAVIDLRSFRLADSYLYTAN